MGIAPDSMDANTIIAKADRIADADSAESLLFRQTLLSTTGVVGIGKITYKVPAYLLIRGSPEGTTLPDGEEDDEGTSWVSVLIGALAFVLGISCLVATFILVRRRMAAKKSG